MTIDAPIRLTRELFLSNTIAGSAGAISDRARNYPYLAAGDPALIDTFMSMGSVEMTPTPSIRFALQLGATAVGAFLNYFVGVLSQRPFLGILSWAIVIVVAAAILDFTRETWQHHHTGPSSKSASRIPVVPDTWLFKLPQNALLLGSAAAFAIGMLACGVVNRLLR